MESMRLRSVAALLFLNGNVAVFDGEIDQIATELSLSPRTVDHHRASLLKKFDMNNSVDLVNFAIKHGYVTIEE